MRAVRYHETGGPEVLQVDEDVPTPEPGHGEVRIDVAAAAVNPVDTYYRAGDYELPGLPAIPGDDVAGVVDAVGPGVGAWRAGDRVFGTGIGASGRGSYAEYATVPAGDLAALPDGVSFAEGAAIAVVGVTAWRALVDHADVEPAETCLIHGGSGGVGHAAVQIADAAGATVTTTASDAYHDRLRTLGADAVLDYGRDDLAAAVTEVGAPDVIVDHRLNDYVGLDADVAAHGARVVGLGDTEPAATIPDVPSARAKELTVSLMSMYNTPDIGAVLDRLAGLLADGRLAPEIERTYGLDEAADAHRAVVEDSFFGKLVVEP
ncbi:NADPH2:quinone reductase [Halarchaeum solikamskense]|uniref:NADPH:quinone reductase n=1 Tax=Halarchaeum nitratireducens TaxID=489913 RepID=UPI001B3AB025|nr:NADPH:quinone reductase [Halarchaeum solikamskense]MBP2250535.1 NADPH2:quinone reductase [Halarchaeum solikamskense]